MNEMPLLDGRAAIVTGGARGIGAAISEALIKNGASVLIADSGVDIAGNGPDPSVAKAFADKLGKGAVAYTNDMGIQMAATEAVEMARDTFGGIDLIINNAAILRDSFVFKSNLDDWDTVIQNNLSGPFYLIAASAPLLREQARQNRGNGESYGWGRIINIISTAGFIGNYGQASYAAAKGGLISLMRITALDMARSGVTCNAVAPFARTRVTETIQPANTEQKIYKDRAMKVEAHHVANFITWLCLERAQNVTGQLFGVRARETMLFNQGRPIATAIADGEAWSMEALTEMVNSRFREHFTGMRTDLEIFNTDPVI